jgi:diadenosine tetraphosphate (Ap4A) HIT family hydrolase
MVVTRRHVDHLGDLTEGEAASVGSASRVIARALGEQGVDRVHLAV